MKQKKQIIMLPSEKPSQIFKASNGLNYYPKPLHQVIPEQAVFQHLYILSDEEIKEGDWYYNNTGRAIEYLKHLLPSDGKYCKKIIATTDPELNCPQIPQHIIEAYVKKPFDEVEVEYEYLGDKGLIIADFSKEPPETVHREEPEPLYGNPKLNPDGTLAVSLVKFIDDFDYSNNPLHPVIEEKMYSREEVIDFGEYLMKLVNSVIKKNTKMKPLNETSGEKLVRDLFDKWIKENL
jgi:hypothetical protein